MSHTIIIVEDMLDTQKWLKEASLLAFPTARVTIAGDLASAEHFIQQHEPSLALIDLKLPDGSGETLIAKLRQSYPDCISIVITIYADEHHLMPSLSAGAQGYILKDQSKERIAQMINQAAIGELPLSPNVAKLVLDHFTATTIESEVKSPLSKRESEVLSLIGKGLNIPQVAIKLAISKYTAEDHLKHVYRKLNISSRAEAALAAEKLKLL